MSKKETTIDDLARMVQNGFMDLKSEVSGLRQDVVKMGETNNKHFELIENAQVDLRLRQDNVAYRFEFQNLEKRVKVLEEKAKFA